MDAVVQIVQTLGFPIACVVFLGAFIYKYVTRIMDENKAREDNYRSMLAEYGAKMAEIANALATIQADIKTIKTH